MDKKKVERFLTLGHQMLENKTPFYDQFSFELGNCYVQLGQYDKAKYYYENSLIALFVPPMIWKDTYQPNWLIDIWVLSGRKDLYADVKRELDAYKKLPTGGSPMAVYTYSLIELLYPTGADFSSWIQELAKRPKYKDMVAISQILRAILDRNQPAFNLALASLLKIHEGIAKYGGLRETAEGLLCMQAMSLAYAAKEHNFNIEIENDYLSLGYLEYLIQ